MNNTLNLLLGNFSQEEFFNKFYNRLPLAVVDGAKDFQDHLNWAVIEHILKVRKSILRIVKNGQMTKDYADISYLEAKQYFEQGHTLVFKNSEKSHPKLTELADRFRNLFFAPIDIQSFITPSHSKGFGWHYDVEDVFIFQTQGLKHFTLRQNTVHSSPTMPSLPRDLGYEKEKSDLFINVTLKEGDWLYIPAGWWHEAYTTDEPSMHISLGVLSRSAVDIIPFLQKALAQNPSWRTRFPLYQKFESPEDEITFYEEGFKHLGEHISTLMTDKTFIKNLLENLRKDF